jgi:proline dehydrogenase
MYEARTRATAHRRLGWLASKLLAPFARRFIAGTTLTQALSTCERLKAQGLATTLDHLGESVMSAGETEIATEQYVVMLKALAERKLDRNVSLKLTQLGLDIDRELCSRNLERVVEAAEGVGGFVRVDMEGSNETDGTLDVVRRAKRNRAVPVGAVLQAMLHRTPEDTVELLRQEVPIRLCKGAYKEPADIALQRMEDVQRAFLALAKRLLTAGGRHAIATHDPELISEVKRFALEQGIGKDRFEFQMLLGIRPRMQRELAGEGYTVRVYVPFGRSWVPYTWRRIRERKENALFVLKHMFVR